MSLSIFCYYTSSNDINPIGAFLMLLFMGIFIIVAIRIWIGNKIDDYKYSLEIKYRDSYLSEEALSIINNEAKSNDKFKQIKGKYTWQQWFIKGYIKGATDGNYYYGYSGPLKRKSDFTLEEWEKYQVISMDLVKDDSEYVGGNKEMALYALFEGHKFGLQRLEKKGEAK